MIYAYIENGFVKQTLRVPPAGLFAAGYASQFIDAPDDVQVGYTYENGVYTPPPPPLPYIPQSVSPRQIRQALTASGLRAAVEAAVAAGSQDMKDWYEFSTSIERNHPMVIAMGEALSVTPTAMDDLFILAASL